MKNRSLNILMKVSLLATMAIVLQQISFPLAFIFPDFLKVDLSDVPALIGGFAFGPVSGILVMLIKNVIKGFIGTHTFWIGELSNFLIGSTIVGISSAIYHRKRNKKRAIIGLGLGTIGMAAVGALTNYFIMLPLYSKVMGFTVNDFVQIGAAINPMIDNIWGYILLMIVPFNILKGVLSSGVVMVLYKSLSNLLKKEHQSLDAKNKLKAKY